MRMTGHGHCATVATASSTPESCRSLEIVLASRYAWLDWVGDHESTDEHDTHDHDASQVFHTAIAITKSLARFLPDHQKRNPQRDCRRGVVYVMDRIREERDTRRHCHYGPLQQRDQ